MNFSRKALYLESGELFVGKGFGASRASGGEAVFNTGLTGYQEIFTDPSYLGQIVAMTYPHIGNTGINSLDFESKKIYLSGVAVREYCHSPSNWRSEKTVHDLFVEHDIPGISGIDTRELTLAIRNNGSQRAAIFSFEDSAKQNLVEIGKTIVSKTRSMEGLDLVSEVSCKTPYEFIDARFNAPADKTIIVYDFGVKSNILRSIRQRGFRVWVVPFNTTAEDVLSKKPVGVVLSNGPGDPATVPGVVQEIKKLIGAVPIMAICMGHQLLARALGIKTYKLKFGHHGCNHPVMDLQSGRVLITSQNHGFSILEDDVLKVADVVVSHKSLNDNTVEGFISEKLKFLSVQFHPEAMPGPNDAAYLFDRYVKGHLR